VRLRLSRVQFLALSILSKTLCIEEWRWKDSQKKWLGVIESYLHAAALPAAPGPQIGDYKLTAAEVRVAVLIRQRKTSKEISELLGISIRTVEVHRNGIRRKLGIRGKKVDLTMHLLSLEYKAEKCLLP
jgi:DNA-binding CsgD family transcriptional regulator